MSAADTAVQDLHDVGQHLARLAKDDAAWDLTHHQAGELLRAVELVNDALASTLHAASVTTTTPGGRHQRALGCERLATSLRRVAAEARRERERRFA